MRGINDSVLLQLERLDNDLEYFQEDAPVLVLDMNAEIKLYSATIEKIVDERVYLNDFNTFEETSIAISEERLFQPTETNNDVLRRYYKKPRKKLVFSPDFWTRAVPIYYPYADKVNDSEIIKHPYTNFITFKCEIDFTSDMIPENYSKVLQKSGILTFFCYVTNSLDELSQKLLTKERNLKVNFRRKYEINLSDYFKFIHNARFFYALKPSIGMKIAALSYMFVDFVVNDEYLELIYNDNCSNFELTFINSIADPNSFLKKAIRNVNFDAIINVPHLTFRAKLNINSSLKYPDLFMNINFKDQHAINRDLALVYLNGKTYLSNPGISSVHMTGSMNPSVRLFNTGFMSFEKRPSKYPDIFPQIFDFLKKSNILYENVDSITEDSSSTFLLSLKDKIGATSALVLPEQSEVGRTRPVLTRGKDILVFISKKSDGETILLPFEVAIASMFPLLFPYGPLPPVEGKTIREKTKNLLFMNQRYRCGPVGSQLVLFCFDLIVKGENYFFQHCIKPKQLINCPPDTDRTINIGSLVRKDDPSFGFYWFTQLQSINAYCEQFGAPDLMVTLTYGNKWEECECLIERIKEECPDFNGSNFGMPYCGVDTMLIFKERLSRFSNKNFEEFIKIANLPRCIHHVTRLEFQGRGAPHVHILMWLERRITEDEIKSHFFGSEPPDEAEFLKKFVNLQMKHTCIPSRCNSGKNKNACKYGFPKQESDDTHYDEDDHLIYKRSESDKYLVEHCPALLLTWGAHAHVHILRSEGNDCNALSSLSYVVKYNMKKEGNMNVVATKSDDVNWTHVFNSRVVSTEEAAARILSMTFVDKDVVCKYIDTSLPLERKANFDNFGRQKSYDDVETYFIRPMEVSELKILEFYSLYDIHYLPPDAQIEDTRKHLVSRPGSIDGLFYSITLRSKTCIVTFRSIDFVKKREQFLYHYLLLDRIHFNEIEITENESYGSLLHFDELKSIEEKYSDPFVYSFLEFLVKHSRFSTSIITNELIRLLKIGYSKEMLINLLLLLRRDYLYDDNEFDNNHMSDDNEVIEDSSDINPLPKGANGCTYDLRVYPNKRIAIIYQDFLAYINTIDLESDLTKFEISKDTARKYISAYYTQEERLKANTEYNNQSIKLNMDQKYVVNSIIHSLPNRTPFFIPGKAGTGKSFVVSCIKNYLVANDIPFIVTASTGIASILIGGRTLHSVFSIFSKNERYHSGLSPNNANGKAMGLCQVIFVDEVTMINKDIFNLIDRKLREIKAQVTGNKEYESMPFGGVTLILTGDLCQVPCIVQNGDDTSEYNSMFNQMDSFNHFTTIPLNIIMRQTNSDSDDPFIKLLEEMRNYTDGDNLSEHAINIIRSRFVSATPESYFEDLYPFVTSSGMAIFYRNASCEIYNDTIMNKLANENGTQQFKYTGYLLGVQKTSFYKGINENMNDKIIATDQDKMIYKSMLRKRESSSLVPYTFKFAISSRVMLLKNIDPFSGLVNGRRGTVVEVLNDPLTKSIIAIIVLFDPISDFPSEQIPIHVMNVDTFNRSNGKTFNFYQFPLKLCYSVTAHKSQGQTLSKVAICIGEKAFAHGSFYVALSRVRKIDDILFFAEKFPDNGPSLHSNNLISDFNFHLNHQNE